MDNKEREKKIKALREIVLLSHEQADKYEALEELLKIYYDWGYSQGGFDAIAD